MKIPIKKYVMDEAASWEERYKQLENHHNKETNWLINALNTNTKKIMAMVYERIAHGDESHRAWLRDECAKIQIELEFDTGPAQLSLPLRYDSEGNYYNPDTHPDEVD